MAHTTRSFQVPKGFAYGGIKAMSTGHAITSKRVRDLGMVEEHCGLMGINGYVLPNRVWLSRSKLHKVLNFTI